MKNIVVAYDMNKAIGKEGGLPWQGQLPADAKRFRDLTTPDTVIMGRSTFDSLPARFQPLPDRQNIVITRHLGGIARREGVFYAGSLEEAYSLAENEEIHVIGGGQIYAEAIDTVDRLYITEIKTEVESPDTFFPDFKDKEDWKLVHHAAHGPDERNKFAYTFATYLRNFPIN